MGHDAGGELVNAVRQRPFSVLLFDEIEKAHPRILDKFLQILEDGRLTDGRGETVFFSESVIIFTSNLGVMGRSAGEGGAQRVTADAAYNEIAERVSTAIADYFRYEIGRPELLNRIGDNVVVFDFVRPPVAREIMKKMIGNLVSRVKDEHDLDLRLADAVVARLEELCLARLENGGRGIGNCLESYLINPLARALFMRVERTGQSVTVADLREQDGRWELTLE